MEKFTYFDFLLELHIICCFQSTETTKVGLASKSNIRRWFENKSILINEIKPNWNDECIFPITQLILFPKSDERRITIL
jgi:hypothetical protein